MLKLKNFPALFEGDIIVLNRLDEYITSNYEGLTNHKTKVKRGAAKEVQLWNNKKEGNNFIVPYVIDSSIGNFVLEKHFSMYS